MQITVEISLYPLHNNYGNEVLAFIHDLRSVPDLIIRTNQMSTQVTGPFDIVMNAIQDSLRKTLQKDQKTSVVMKIFNEGLELDWLDI